MDLTACPEPGCDLPAEISERAVLESTDEPVEHARLVCVNGHRFFMPTLTLPQDGVVGPAEALTDWRPST